MLDPDDGNLLPTVSYCLTVSASKLGILAMIVTTSHFRNTFAASFRMSGYARICAVVAWGLGLASGVGTARAMTACDWDGSIGNRTDGGQWNLGYYPNDGHPDPGDTYLVI